MHELAAVWLRILLVLAVTVVAVVLVLAVIEWAGSRRRRVRGRCFWRLAWYRLTKRMPGSCPVRDLYRLSDEDRAEFGAIAITYHLGPAVSRHERAAGDRPGGESR